MLRFVLLDEFWKIILNLLSKIFSNLVIAIETLEPG